MILTGVDRLRQVGNGRKAGIRGWGIEIGRYVAAAGIRMAKAWQDRKTPPCAPVVPGGGLFLQSASCSVDDSCADSKADGNKLTKTVLIMSQLKVPTSPRGILLPFDP